MLNSIKFLFLFIIFFNNLYGYSANCYVKSWENYELKEKNKYIHINVKNKILTLKDPSISYYEFDSIYEGEYVYSAPPAFYITIGKIKNNTMKIHADFDDGYGYKGLCNIKN